MYKWHNTEEAAKVAIYYITQNDDAEECRELRTKSLMSHVRKVLRRIIHAKIHKKLEDISGTQFSFRNGFGMR